MHEKHMCFLKNFLKLVLYKPSQVGTKSTREWTYNLVQPEWEVKGNSQKNRAYKNKV